VIGVGESEVLSRRHERRDYRFAVNLETRLEWNAQIFPVQIFNLSPGGAAVRIQGLGKAIQENHDVEGGVLVLPLPHHSPLRIPLERIKARYSKKQGNCVEAGVVFKPLDPSDRMALFEFLFVDLAGSELRYRQQKAALGAWRSCLEREREIGGRIMPTSNS
jgi:hypothetical protein